jgi:hypothetical protein
MLEHRQHVRPEICQSNIGLAATEQDQTLEPLHLVDFDQKIPRLKSA